MRPLHCEPKYQDATIEDLIPYEYSIGAVLIKAKEAVIAPIRCKLRDEKITEPQWRIMRALNDRGQASATTLAEICSLHLPSVSRILRMLVSHNYVLRQADPVDGRKTNVVLSSEGKELVNANAGEVAQIIAGFSERFGAERLGRLIHELEALSASIDDTKDEA